MKIQRHDIDPTGLRSNFDGDPDGFRSSVEAGRRSAANLGMLSLDAIAIALTGTLFEPDSLTVARALRVAAQAAAAPFGCPHDDWSARPVRLGEGPPVNFSQPARRSDVGAAAWLGAFDLAVIARQRDLIELLLWVPPGWLRETVGDWSEHSFHLAEARRALWGVSGLEGHPSLAWLREYYVGAISRSDDDARARELIGPGVDLMPPLAAGDGPAFGARLAEGLRLHKKYWGTPKRRQNRYGWASFGLSALAALAHDRGLRFDVGSDYIPRSWVTGDVFRHLAPAEA